ncbi:MAG: hypothetical protein ACK5XN_31475 [Bacteroidota bacterium]
MSDQKNPLRGLSLWVPEKDSQANALKQYLAWLKSHGARTRFSHAHPMTTLHLDLNVLDNLLMAIGEGSFEGSYFEKENFIKSRLESLELRVLSSWYKDPRRKTQDLSCQEILVASVSCALLIESDAAFIDLTSSEIDPLCQIHLQQVLLKYAQTRHVTVLLNEKGQWQEVFQDELKLTPQGLERFTA